MAIFHLKVSIVKIYFLKRLFNLKSTLSFVYSFDCMEDNTTPLLKQHNFRLHLQFWMSYALKFCTQGFFEHIIANAYNNNFPLSWLSWTRNSSASNSKVKVFRGWYLGIVQLKKCLQIVYEIGVHTLERLQQRYTSQFAVRHLFRGLLVEMQTAEKREKECF